MSDRSDLGAFLSGFIIGGLVGAVVAILIAPQSGEETRTLIRDKSIELKDKAVASAEEARVRASEMAKKGQEFYEQQVSRVKKAAEPEESEPSA